MNKFLLLATSLLSLTACNTYNIEGTSSVSSLDGKMLYVKVWKDNQMVNIDSCEIIHGKFAMKGEVDSVMLTTLYLDEQPVMPVVIEKGNISVKIDDIRLKASGTELNDKLDHFIEQQQSISNRAEDLSHKESQLIMNGETADNVQRIVQAEGEKLNDEMNQLVKTFITENYENALGAGVFMILCSNMPYPMLTPEIEAILNDAPDSFKNNTFIKQFVESAHKIQQQATR